jgi:predicted permease
VRGFLHDLRVASRLLAQNPGLSAACIVTLALGIGANVTIYSFADAVLFRPLAVPNATRLVHVFERRDQPGTYPMSFADYPVILERSRSFEALAAHYSNAPLHVLFDGEPESMNGAVTTASYFEVLQIAPAIGRFFTREEDRERGRDAVAVISYSVWQRRFGGDVSILGRSVTVNGQVFTVIGVAPQGFTGVQGRGTAVDLWVPSAMFDVGYRYCDAFIGTCRIVQLLGRLHEGVSVEHARRELESIASALPERVENDPPARGVIVQPARGHGYTVDSSERRQLDVFLGAASLVLLITCANTAGLLLTRATARRRHLAVRVAMGAGRWRVASHVMAESVLLAALGGAAALLAGTWSTDALRSVYAVDSAGRALSFDLAINAPVVAASVGLTLVVALVAGGIPAWHASRTDVISVLKDEGASGGSRRARLRHLLVGVQVAISVVLLVGAVLLIESGRRALQGPGFDPAQVVTLRLRPSLVGYARERAHTFQRHVIDHIATLPGVVSASPSVYMSVFSAGPTIPVTTDAGSGDAVEAIGNAVGARYFSTLDTPLVDGREFTDADREGGVPVAIVNDVLAQRLWPNQRAVGMTVRGGGRPLTIVGVVRDAQYYVEGDAPRPQIFLNYWQTNADETFNNDSRLFVRVAGDAAAMVSSIHRAVARVDSAVPVSEVSPLRDRVAYMFQPVRAARLLLTAAALLAVVLCAIGLYGVLAHAVSERTREIGLRVAIGATRGHIAQLMLRDAVAVIGTGTLVGLVAARHSTQFVSNLLFGVSGADPVAFMVAPLGIVVIAVLASYVPMRRALRVSPLKALRVD